MKIKNKGKVHPSPSSSSSSSSTLFSHSTNKDALSVLTLLPAAILALVSVLSSQDREVLAYLITHSLKTTTNPNPPLTPQESKKKPNKNPSTAAHKKPIFDCDCFDCYTSYWYRWDSSPNRELIHQAIEAFEEHLANGEQSKKNGRGRRRDKTVRKEKAVDFPLPQRSSAEGNGSFTQDIAESAPEKLSPQKKEAAAEIAQAEANTAEAAPALAVANIQGSNHKGLARKVLPDVLGILNSRLWSLWGPDV